MKQFNLVLFFLFFHSLISRSFIDIESINLLSIKYNIDDIASSIKLICDREYVFNRDAGSTYYIAVSNLIRENNLKIGAEIGVLYGGLSDAIIEKNKLDKFYLIDPYDSNFFGSSVLSDVMYYNLVSRFKRSSSNIEIIRKSSLLSSYLINDYSLDFVFIDGDHTYEAVKEDISLWFSKLKDGGFFIGDDYHISCPGVIQAVDEFCLKNNYKFQLIMDRIWLIIK